MAPILYQDEEGCSILGSLEVILYTGWTFLTVYNVQRMIYFILQLFICDSASMVVDISDSARKINNLNIVTVHR